ncbi:MAG: OsmC family protein [Anaerolineae bacterium]
MEEGGSYDARATWVEGLQFVGFADTSGTAIVLDGAPTHGGLGSSVRPMEALLLSLASCTGMDVLSILQKKRQDITAFRVNAHGVRAAEWPKQFVRIELEFVARGRAIQEDALARAIELSQTKYCGVTASLKSEITSTYRIEPEETARERP